MRTLEQMNFTENQKSWVLDNISNFQGILEIEDENKARILACNLMKESGATDSSVYVYHVWNGISGDGSRYGYTIGWSKRMRSLFENGIEPAVIDTENEGFKRI